uniref:Uncharacterized protein n=1 Tax=Nelumbo nucifera TaxID=4432 RepID=A0A822ZMM4_NELNU|nr:TPA_asm: hypothetical protein HUJ06_001258 [Nelumbo nucifera]
MLRGEVGDLQAKVAQLEFVVEQLAHCQGMDALFPTPPSVQKLCCTLASSSHDQSLACRYLQAR